jgi:hypothetical protein
MLTHPASTYKHFQDSGGPANGGDDHHTPVQPHRYIELRIKKNIAFYEARIPKYNWRRGFYKFLVVLLSVGATALARYKMASLVIVVTAASAAITSWVEFTDMANKGKRYSRVITGLENLLDWWNSLTEVQKASRERIGEFITVSEGLINEEQVGWTRMAKKMDKKMSSGSSSANVKEATDRNTSHNTNTKVHPSGK